MSNLTRFWLLVFGVVYFAAEIAVVGTLVAGVIIFPWGIKPRVVRVAQALTQPSPTLPAPTRTPRPTFTPLPTPTFVPTFTPTTMPSPSPTDVPTSTPKKPAVTATRTKTPAPAPTKIAALAPTKSPYTFRVDAIRCYHSGNSFVEGLVLEKWGSAVDKFSGINGLKVRMSYAPNGPAVDYDFVTEDHWLIDEVFPPNRYAGWFGHPVAPGAAPGQIRYVWVVDGDGRPLSDPNAGKAVFDAGKGDNACWNVQIVFVKFQ